jgi:hypothetical protein
MTTNDGIETITDHDHLEAIEGGTPGGADCFFFILFSAGLVYAAGTVGAITEAVIGNPLYDRYCAS